MFAEFCGAEMAELMRGQEDPSSLSLGVDIDKIEVLDLFHAR